MNTREDIAKALEEANEPLTMQDVWWYAPGVTETSIRRQLANLVKEGRARETIVIAEIPCFGTTRWKHVKAWEPAEGDSNASDSGQEEHPERAVRVLRRRRGVGVG